MKLKSQSIKITMIFCEKRLLQLKKKMDPFWLFQNTHRPLAFMTPRKTYPITCGLSWWHIDIILLVFFVHVLNNQGENYAGIKDSQVKRGNYKQLEPEKKNVIFTIILHSSLFFCKYFSYMWVALPLDGRAVAFWWSLNCVSITTRKRVWRLPSARLKLRTEAHIGFIHPPICPSIHPTIYPTIHSSYKYSLPLKRTLDGTSLAIQWLRLCTSTSGSMGSPLVQEPRSHKPRPKIYKCLDTDTMLSHFSRVWLCVTP